MAGIQDFWEDTEDFFGGGAFAATGTVEEWVLKDTSAAGSPTAARVNGASSGEAAIDFDNTNEVQNVSLSYDDKLCFDIDKIQGAEFRVKMNQAAIDATSQLAFGLIGARNDAIDSIAQAAIFRVVGADSATAVVVETADGTVNNDDVATGQTLINAYKTFKIDFSNGTSDVRFYMDDGNGTMRRVAASTTFDMSNYTGSMQPIIQLQKTADVNTDGVTVDYLKVWGTR